MKRPTSVLFPTAKGKEAGEPAASLDEATLQKAEARYLSFYEVYASPDSVAQGPASFE